MIKSGIIVVGSFGLVFVLLLVENVHTQRPQRYKTIFHRIQEHPDYNSFNSLIRTNRVAKLNLHHEQLTVFVPENEAFAMFDGEMNPDLVFYHMSFELKTLYELNYTNFITTVVLENPPLWITRAYDDIYVNNARVLQDKSDYISRTYHGDMAKQQVLHMVDEVLNPYITWPKYSPNAYDLLTSPTSWNIDAAARSVFNFLTKVQEYKLQYIYKQEAGHTFFVPVDRGIDAHKFKTLDKHLILGHVIPYYVLFTRPTKKNFRYESLANDDYIYIVLSLEERDGKMYVKGTSSGTIGDFKGRGEFEAEILVANIPVKNGVVHLISQPLGIFKRTLKPFPYLTILDKLSNDPNLDVFYQMGENTGFHDIFKRANVSFTYFVPIDKFWTKVKEEGLQPIERDLQILQRHMVVSSNPYSIEQLHSLTKANNYTGVELPSEDGMLRVMILQRDGEYYIKWHRYYVKVVRPNYECSNGMVHLLAGPFINLRRVDDSTEQLVPANMSENYWRSMKGALRKIF